MLLSLLIKARSFRTHKQPPSKFDNNNKKKKKKKKTPSNLINCCQLFLQLFISQEIMARLVIIRLLAVRLIR